VNFLKNLLIIAVLAAVGYGVYVSLARNNADSSPPPGVADGWPTVPKVELPSTKASPSPGGPLPLSTPLSAQTSDAVASQPTAQPGVNMGTLAPLAPPPVAASTNNPLGAAPSTAPAVPYSSSPMPPSTPVASLGQPTTPATTTNMAMPNALSTTTGSSAAPPVGSTPPAESVRNLAPPPSASAFNNASPPAAGATDPLLQSKFAAFMDAVQKKLDEGKLAEAHAALSTFYGNTDLSAQQSKQISDLLDQLAGTVIYSRKHYLEPAYVTQQGDTLDRISQRYNVPWQLLARINGLMPPGVSNNDNATKDQPLPLGIELKVVRGPFEAVVHTDRHELTLMLQNRYAGRFPIGVGGDLPKVDGSYTVREKAPSVPQGVAGGPWIGLTDRIGIQGAGSPQAIGRDDNRGAICVGDRDLQDLYGILSVGSRVTIVR
jgi:hypothetical protein